DTDKSTDGINSLTYYSTNYRESNSYNRYNLWMFDVSLYSIIVSDYRYVVEGTLETIYSYSGNNSGGRLPILRQVINSNGELDDEFGALVTYASNLGSSSNGGDRYINNPIETGTVTSLVSNINYFNIMVPITWSIVPEVDVTLTGISITNNVLTIDSSASIDNSDGTSGTTFIVEATSEGDAKSVEITVSLDVTIPDVESDYVITGWVETATGVYTPANQVFESPKLIGELYNDETNINTTVTNAISFTDTDGKSITTTDAYVLSESEINAVTVFNMGGVGIFSIEGIEIFTNIEQFTMSGSGAEQESISIEPISDMELTYFAFYNGYDSARIVDWTPLLNSKDTLTNFYYGEYSTTRITPLDLSFLLAFSNDLNYTYINTAYGYLKSGSFTYILGWYSIYESSANIQGRGIYGTTVYLSQDSLRDDERAAAEIMSNFTSKDSSITYSDGYELELNTTTGILPDSIDYGGKAYDITWINGANCLTLGTNGVNQTVSINTDQTNVYNRGILIARVEIDGFYYERAFTIYTD
ncbi:MAG: hypothetical protein WCR33_06480, partial [Bacilli bacterium]